MVFPASLPEDDPFKNIRGFAPDELLDLLSRILGFFPEEFRYRVRRVIESVPSEGDNLHKVFELLRSQWSGISSEDSVRISITGPSQTGKSTLLQAVRRQEDGDAPIFRIVETPGLEEYLGFGSGGETAREIERSDVVILVLDARYEMTEQTLGMVESLRASRRPLLIVLNKIDMVDDPSRAMREAKRALGSTIFPLSARETGSVKGLLRAVVSANSKTLYPLSQHFPEFRKTICSGIVTQAALTGGLVAAIPIPVADLLPLTAVQTGMLLKIARAFGYRLTRKRARELIPMLIAGSLVREGVHRLGVRFPHQVKLISVTVAGLWTMLLGRLAVIYFEETNPSRGLEPVAAELREARRLYPSHDSA